MRLRTALIAALAAIFLVGGTALATTERDVTSRLAGKIGDLFKINGGLHVTKNTTIDGTLTVKKLAVYGQKRYAGKIDTSKDGDFISTYSYSGIDCTTMPGTYVARQQTHYKSMAIPEIKSSALPDVRVYYKALAAPSSVYSPSQYPNDNNVWISGGFVLQGGKLFFAYKSTQTTCAGTITSNILTTGDYQVVVN